MGLLFYDQDFVAYTLELPWKNNERNISCIPWGRYKVSWHVSPKFGETLHVYNTPSRSGIIIHAGNYARDTRGCILLGRTTDWKQKIGASGPAMGDLRRLVAENDIKEDALDILPCPSERGYYV